MLAFVLSAVLGCGDLCSEAAVFHYAELLAEGGYGRLPLERGAFLIRERGGSITAAPWTDSRFQRATFRGSIPPGTIAIAHTHPRAIRFPSAADVEQARRSKLPVVVITPDNVTAALPDGSIRTLTARPRWWTGPSAAKRPDPVSETGRPRPARHISLPR